jgi:chorismate mutase/prephenate dehydratase
MTHEKSSPNYSTLEIKGLREEINSIDETLLNLLAKRRQLSKEVIEHKEKENGPVRDIHREEELLRDRIRQGRAQGLDSHLVTRVFHEIIDDSIRIQHRKLQRFYSTPSKRERIAYHGIQSSYCEQAAKRHFEKLSAGEEGRVAEFRGFPTFEAVVQAVRDGEADSAILPIENTLSGGINEVFDLLVQADLAIIGEEKFRIDHQLLATQDSDLSSIRSVLCSYLSYGDCRQFLHKLNVKIEHLSDSAMCAERISELNDPSVGAIASGESAERFGLKSVARDIANHHDNFIRYLVVAKETRPVDPRIPCKTSLIIGTPQYAGALADVLLVFKRHGINLTKLENRPVAGQPWEEIFYLDFEGNIAVDDTALALKEVARATRFLRVLGSYPSYDLARTAVSSNDVESLKSSASYSDSSNQALTSTFLESEASGLTKSGEKIPDSPTKGKKKSYTLASREHKPEDTIIEVKGVRIGGSSFVTMAGPCSVESRDQIFECAHHAKESGALILRGGCFKPRTSPYSFQGLGMEGVKLLAEAGEAYSLPIITEVMAPEDVEPVAELSDMLQIGARNMQNFTLLKAVGRTTRPVLLKRGMSSSLEDLLNAAEYILAQGNQQVILCERGIRTFETWTRSTLDVAAVPVLRRESHLPVIIDPSHAAGERDLVPSLARASKAVGAHGVIIEFHPKPEQALSDGPQALRFPQILKLIRELEGATVPCFDLC